MVARETVLSITGGASGTRQVALVEGNQTCGNLIILVRLRAVGEAGHSERLWINLGDRIGDGV